MSLDRPAPGEVDDYYLVMIDPAPDGDVLAHLGDQVGAFRDVLGEVPDERARTPYEPGKWSLKQLVGHVIDTEVIMTARALAFARGEKQPLPGFDQDEYVGPAAFDDRSMTSLLDTLAAVRGASIALFSTLPESAHAVPGNADGRALSPRGIAWLLCGHAGHHLKVAQERYIS